MDIKLLLRLMSEKNASDLFFSAGAPPFMKIEGISTPMGTGALPGKALKEIAYSLMDERLIEEFEEEWECNFAFSLDDVGRFRVNVFKQRGEVGMVMRHIKYNVPALENLGLPRVIRNLVTEPSGLVLICGPTGSGKSTTLASMIDYRNSNHPGHILTVEDPVEFLHPHKMSVVDQREVGVDTKSFDNALKNAMREAPDVILIGEIRDSSAMKHALSYAQSGHLVLATIHGNNSRQVLERASNMFPKDMRQGIIKELGGVLKGIVAQRLIRTQDGKRMPINEILLPSPDVIEIVEKGLLGDLTKAIENNRNDGMMTFDQSLYRLTAQGKISREDALHFAESRTDLALKFKLGSKRSATTKVQQSPDDGGMSFKTKL
jgi:twitching motility protein PilU